MREQFEERSIDESSFKSAGDRRFCLCAEGGQEILSRSPFVEVVGTARDGLEALDLVERLEPDVVTCDLIMPELDGVGFVREQMKRRPLPIIIMSIANETAEAALTALDAGAIDFVQSLRHSRLKRSSK